MSATLPPPPPTDLAAKLDSCIAYYSSLDQNKNGVKDWAVVEGTDGTVLYPNDPDIDGDGIENVFDPDPMHAGTPVLRMADGRLAIPPHLAMEGERGRVQREIYEKVGVLAIDHTDRHSLGVLEAFRDVAVRALSPGFEKKAPSLKYLYAFKGHDSRVDIAAYHREMQALSIGGESAWGRGPRTNEDRVRIMAALAHETGHAFSFDKLSALEMARIGTLYGHWSNLKPGTEATFHDAQFLKLSHPLRHLASLLRDDDPQAADFIRRSVWTAANIVSRYSTTNLHEWFADAFAADVLNRLGERGLIPATDGDWHKSLALVPRKGEWWANYNNVSPGFRLWLKSKLDAGLHASLSERAPASR